MIGRTTWYQVNKYNTTCMHAWWIHSFMHACMRPIAQILCGSHVCFWNRQLDIQMHGWLSANHRSMHAWQRVKGHTWVQYHVGAILMIMWCLGLELVIEAKQGKQAAKSECYYHYCCKWGWREGKVGEEDRIQRVFENEV